MKKGGVGVRPVIQGVPEVGKKGIQLEWIGTCMVGELQQRMVVRYVLIVSCKSRADGSKTRPGPVWKWCISYRTVARRYLIQCLSYYLSINFIYSLSYTPTVEAHLQAVLYPIQYNTTISKRRKRDNLPGPYGLSSGRCQRISI